jgi:hypothetical protein
MFELPIPVGRADKFRLCATDPITAGVGKSADGETITNFINRQCPAAMAVAVIIPVCAQRRQGKRQAITGL